MFYLFFIADSWLSLPYSQRAGPLRYYPLISWWYLSFCVCMDFGDIPSTRWTICVRRSRLLTYHLSNPICDSECICVTNHQRRHLTLSLHVFRSIYAGTCHLSCTFNPSFHVLLPNTLLLNKWGIIHRCIWGKACPCDSKSQATWGLKVFWKFQFTC